MVDGSVLARLDGDRKDHAVMDIEAAWLLSQIKEEQKRVSDRMHRDSRRQHTLRQASLMIGTGIPADGVKDWLAGQHVMLTVTRKTKEAYDQYGRRA